MKANKTYKGSIIVFTIILVFLIVPSIVFFNEFLYVKNNCTKAEAEITHITYIGDDNYVTVGFEYHGSYVEREINEYSSNWYVGDNITIYYNEDLTKIYSYLYATIFPIIFLSMFSIFFVIDGVCIILSIKAKKKDKWLKENGQKIYAKITSIKVNYNVSYGGVHPVTIECCYKKGAQMLTLKKKVIQKDYINLENKKVAVYYNAENMKEYMIDLEDIVDDNDENYNSDDYNYNQDYSYNDKKEDYKNQDDYKY